MKHLVIGQRLKILGFSLVTTRKSGFHWSAFRSHGVVHLPKSTETSLITESYQSGSNHQLLQLGMAYTAWSESDQAVRGRAYL